MELWILSSVCIVLTYIYEKEVGDVNVTDL